MPSLCIITFNENPAGVYFGGQTLSGRVCLTTDRIKAIRGVYIKINGYAQVRWSESTSTTVDGKTTTTTTWYTAHDNYFKSRVDILHAPGGDRFDLTPGYHEYHFQIILPPNLPSSFIGQYGTIAYEVKCVIDRPWKFDNVFKHPFTILAPLDLNTNLMFIHPVERQEVKEFSKICCCGDGGRIWVKGYIPLGGFAPGQSIPVTMSIENQSKIGCSETNACLTQKIEYTSYTPIRKLKYEIRHVTVNLFGPFEKMQKKNLSCNLYIPSVPPTSLDLCNIIRISYYVEIELKTRGLHTNMNVTLPITIGTVPYYYNYNQTAERVPMSSQIPVTPDAPPTYEQAITLGPNYMSEIEEDKHTPRVDFIPRYPVYNFMENATAPALEHLEQVVTMQTSQNIQKY